jgi:hypothetical protein
LVEESQWAQVRFGRGSFFHLHREQNKESRCCPLYEQDLPKVQAGVAHPDELCPKNFEGTSKAMEGHGAVVNAKWLYA